MNHHLTNRTFTEAPCVPGLGSVKLSSLEDTPPEAARGKPGAVHTWVLTAHPESAPDGLLKGKIDLFGALRGVPPMRGPPSRDLKGFTRYLRRSRVF